MDELELSTEQLAAAEKSVQPAQRGPIMRPSSRQDWRKSPAHLLFLSTFLRPRTAEDLSALVDWRLVLGEEPQRAIECFLTAGVIVHADVSEHLAHHFKVTELKEMLRERDLPGSGRKNDLVLRLVQADPEDMERVVAG